MTAARPVLSLLLVAAACGAGSGALGVDAGGGASGGAGGAAGSSGQGGASGGAGGAAGSSGQGGTSGGGAGGAGSSALCGGVMCTGACVGRGCDGAWICTQPSSGCTKDLTFYCGCDGATFQGSGTCPTRPYRFRGRCEDGADCDHRKVLCRAATPDCEEGEVPSVEGICWGACVPIGDCRCSSPADCPEADRYTCHNSRQRCGPYVN